MAAHNELGRWGEELAARHLERQGFKILFRDWHCGHRDLDLIAQKEDEDLLVIVEVKTRRNERFGDASLAVTPQKIRSIIIATNAFVKTYQVHSRIRHHHHRRNPCRDGASQTCRGRPIDVVMWASQM